MVRTRRRGRLARRLADGIYQGETSDGLIGIVERLSEVIGNGPAEFLATLTGEDPDGNPVPPDSYALRADLHLDGR